MPAGPKAKEARPSRSALVAVAALSVIGVAGVLSYRSIEGELALLFPARAAAPDPGKPTSETKKAEVEDEDAMTTRSTLVVIRDVKEEGGRPVVLLRAPTGAIVLRRLRNVQLGILAREIVRQSMLIAARDELGLSTRDEVLGDAPPAGQGSAYAAVASLLRGGKHATVEVGRGEEGRKGLLLKRDLLPPVPIYDLIDLATAAEALSRTEFPKTLKALGLEGKPNPIRAEAELPGSVEDRLARLGFTEPLAAVRDLHAAIHDDGESPARLGALVRGYALLGVLTEFHWGPAHKAFKARALLYAQRLIARDPDSPWGLWHRAFAEALVSLHKKALDDLDRAKTLAGRKDAPPAPAWVDLIDAYCHYDLDRLKVVNGPQARLAALLRMFAVECPRYSTVPLRAAKDVLALDPECFRAHDVMCRVGGVANLHVATTVAPQVLDQIVPQRLLAIGTMPADVRDQIDRKAGAIALVKALDRAGAPGEDVGEPSWGVFGHLIRETQFIHVQRRLNFMRYQWAVPVDDFWEQARPLVADHRFLPYLESEALGTPEANRVFSDSFLTFRLADFEMSAADLVTSLNKIANAKGGRAWRLEQFHVDHIARDFATHIEHMGAHPPIMVHDANKILRLSPDNPFAMATLIENDWDNSKPRLDEWEKKAGNSTAWLGALGRRYTKMGDFDKARDYLKRYIRQSPEYWAYELLAKNYKDRGDTAQWLATLDEYLNQGEDHGLSAARVRVAIADHYMSLGEWAKAQPYAEDAAQTWAAWAMICAQRCYEGMEDWERAEQWAQRVSERYPNTSLFDWFLFCKRTGHGDADAAGDLAEQYIQAVGDRPDLVSPETAGYFYWLDGSPRKALDSFRAAYDSTASVSAGCALVMLADDLGDSAQRDTILDELCTKYRDKAPHTIQVFGMFHEALKGDDPAALDLEAVDEIVADTKVEARGNLEFVVGWFLKKHGKAEDAWAYLDRCIRSPHTFGWLRSLATEATRTPGAVRPPVRVDPRTTS